MSNHYHIVAKLYLQQVDTWNNEDVVERWLHLFKGPLILQQFNQGKLLVPVEQEMALRTIAIWRKRLQDLSWFMKCLNIALCAFKGSSLSFSTLLQHPL